MKAVFVVLSLLLLTSCQSVRQPGAGETKQQEHLSLSWKNTAGWEELLPPWPLCKVSPSIELSLVEEEYFRYWKEAYTLSKDKVPQEKYYLESQKILNQAILSSSGRDLELLRIFHDCQYFLFKVREINWRNLYNAGQMEKALDYIRLLKKQREIFKEELGVSLSRQLEFESNNRDWCGIEYGELFNTRKPVMRLPDIWMVRCGEKVSMDLQEWRNSNPSPLQISEDWKVQLKGSEGALWLLQSFEIPEDGKGKGALLFADFSGKCEVFINGRKKYKKENEGREAFAISFDYNQIQDKQCIVVLHLPDGIPEAASIWPVWLASEN